MRKEERSQTREPTGEKVEEKSNFDSKAYTLEWWDPGAILARVAMRVAHAFLAVQVPPLAMHFMMMTSCGESRSRSLSVSRLFTALTAFAFALAAAWLGLW